jgi:DNA-binding transcriptional regulator YdaS (Cro superfamily)
MTFREALFKAAEEMKLNRFQMLRLRLRMMMPSTAREIEAAAVAEVMAQGLAPSVQQIDWEKLFEFLKWLIPILLDLFG